MLWISNFAPTSTPLVGSSSSSTRGSVASHLATTTFCWLPPLSASGRSRSTDGVRIARLATSASAVARSRGCVDRAERRVLAARRQHQVVPHRQIEEAAPAAADPPARARGRRARRRAPIASVTGAAVDRDAAGVGARGRRSSRAARCGPIPTRPNSADDLAGPDVERHVREPRRARQ